MEGRWRNGGWVREGEKLRVVRVKEKFSNLHTCTVGLMVQQFCLCQLG